MGQLRRCKANYQMLNYILADLMPWYEENYDFTYIDVNRPMDNIRGFTRETFIEITTNIESQEVRRLQNAEFGYPEHPRAATTDDVECFFSLTRRQIGDTFTVPEFQNQWAKIVREFCKRLDLELPFHYWTRNERFKTEESGFDEDVDEKRLHTVRHTRREDCSIFTSGRAFLPARNKALDHVYFELMLVYPQYLTTCSRVEVNFFCVVLGFSGVTVNTVYQNSM
ncbi:hypothetical protein KP79_PYT07067 [Mizuhopecten yessoensis]|uniref:Uncharacterized protein n=1 Tax=Mizuhopecten yessoensis TaxID=6573 RepID=A0A210QA03_MIZYE|nr:hypothetical protein KP79_PYT07067 [Mizuhopecten yessoensis]